MIGSMEAAGASSAVEEGCNENTALMYSIHRLEKDKRNARDRLHRQNRLIEGRMVQEQAAALGDCQDISPMSDAGMVYSIHRCRMDERNTRDRLKRQEAAAAKREEKEEAAEDAAAQREEDDEAAALQREQQQDDEEAADAQRAEREDEAALQREQQQDDEEAAAAQRAELEDEAALQREQQQDDERAEREGAAALQREDALYTKNRDEALAVENAQLRRAWVGNHHGVVVPAEYGVTPAAKRHLRNVGDRARRLRIKTLLAAHSGMDRTQLMSRWRNLSPAIKAQERTRRSYARRKGPGGGSMAQVIPCPECGIEKWLMDLECRCDKSSDTVMVPWTFFCHCGFSRAGCSLPPHHSVPWMHAYIREYNKENRVE
jgi:hypothetical protein